MVEKQVKQHSVGHLDHNINKVLKVVSKVGYTGHISAKE